MQRNRKNANPQASISELKFLITVIQICHYQSVCFRQKNIFLQQNRKINNICWNLDLTCQKHFLVNHFNQSQINDVRSFTNFLVNLRIGKIDLFLKKISKINYFSKTKIVTSCSHHSKHLHLQSHTQVCRYILSPFPCY